MPDRKQYVEGSLSICTPPLDLAVALARRCADPYVVYERDGEWALARGAAFELTVDARGVHRVDPTERRTWTDVNTIAAVEAALSSIPLRGWRIYGTASFELAYLLHGIKIDRAISAASETEPWLHLCIPSVEVRLRQGEALIRVLDSGRLEMEVELVASLDRADAPNLVERPTCRMSSRSSRLSNVGLQDETTYKELVRLATREIGAGRLQKVIASRVVPISSPVDIVATYAAGRRANSPARSFMIDRGGMKVAGFSPETVLEVSASGRVSTQPLAGTRALVADEVENTRLRTELLRDAKELAEHAISVKVAFEELKRVCCDDSVAVSEFMSVRHRGAVQHLASRVIGTLEDGETAWSAFQALFPAVTASGVPKREALDWIRQHEPEARGLYAGAVVVAGDDGSLDAALILRTIFQRGARTWLRAGAGIVEQSTPEREFQETCEKLESITPHIVISASEFLHAQGAEPAHA
ncbi:MAG TPA: salicylate synthase [Polyangiaceae bacterium]